MTRYFKLKYLLIAVLVIALLSGWRSYNTIQLMDEEVKAAWAQVTNMYKRRSDLLPALLGVVKGYASHEKEVLTQVAEARAKVGSININADDPQSMQAFQAAQSQLQSAIGRLLIVSEKYPQLQANQNFLQLQAQLEGTENRIAVERQRHIEVVQRYNTYVRLFPRNLMAAALGYSIKPNFSESENEAELSKPPVVDFSTP